MHLGQRKMQQFGPTLNLPALLDFLEQQSMPVASSKVRRAIKCPSFSDTVAIAHFYLQLRLRAAQFNARAINSSVVIALLALYHTAFSTRIACVQINC
jgi:hypothetical protein